jgi:ParB-like chromosome segregation protein Spo0J
MKPVSAAFDFNGVTLPVTALRPIRQVKPADGPFGKYRALLASIRAVGLIEPMIVCPAAGVAHAYVVLDGHLRLNALQELQRAEAFCHLIRDHDVLTPNEPAP